MKIAIYNQMFGMNGRSLFSNISGHLSVHFSKNPKSPFKKMKLPATINTIKKSNADVVGICEVLEGQENFLAEGLRRIGYKYCLFGDGHKTKKSNLVVKVAIASKIPCKADNLGGFPIMNEMGGGGGYLRCKFPSIKTDIWCIHLANPKKKKLYAKQIGFLQKNLRGVDNKIILMGDFNLPYDKISEKFSDLSLMSNRCKTCSMTPLFKIFKFQDLDHIFSKGFIAKEARTIDGISDHKLLMAEVD